MVKRVRAKKTELKMTEGILIALMSGDDWLGELSSSAGRLQESEEGKQRAYEYWQRYKREVMEYCQRDHVEKRGQPLLEPIGLFRRPWAWWAFEASEERRKITPTCWMDKIDPRESEKDYLVRLNLLTEVEKVALNLNKTY